MPFVRVDPEAYDDLIAEIEDLDPEELPEGFTPPANRPSGDYEYEAKSARFEPKRLGEGARLALDALRDLGATAFRVRYDGGYDEGFAHPDSVAIGGVEQPAAEVAGLLAAGGLAGRLRARPDLLKLYGGWFGTNPTDGQAATALLDDLAHELASRLLGDGFGTGEYSLYGAFTADLAMGQIADDPDAEKPAGLDDF